MQCCFLDRRSLDQDDLDFSSLDHVVPGWQSYAATASDQVPDRIRTAEMVISNKVVLDQATLEQAADLKLICVAATGTNNVDLEAARARGIMVCNVTAYATPSVVEHVFALLLSLVRRLPRYAGLAMDGHWRDSEQFCVLDAPITELGGKTLGIVGYGELGKAVAQVAQAFGMRVLIARRPGSATCTDERLPLQDLLEQVDVLSLHCPLTEATHNLIGEAQLQAMKPGALLINTARGGIVDEQALACALREGWIAGAGVDVLHEEPPRQGNILLEPGIPNLIVTPHVAWASRESRQRLLDEVANNIHAFLDGTPRNRVA